MIKNEIILADITKEKKVLHIGCGPIPATSILLTKKSGIKVLCIDKNPNSVNQARICVSKTGVSDKIKITHGDARSYPIKDFDIIIISQGIKPIKEILEYISKSMKDDAHIIFRTSSTPDGKISKKDQIIKDIFKIDKIVAQKKNALLISILLSKRKS
jgi:precorrin-6B methylase 2